MDIVKQIIISSIILLAWADHALAIEGLQISVQCSNVVLSWPSVEGETYIVQYRPDLGSTNSWTTLTNNMPADEGTNLTFFVHSNIVQNPVCNGGSMGMMSLNEGVDSTAETVTQSDVPMAIRTDGTGSAVPLALYPEGFDLSGFVIFDPITGESLSGAGYSRISPLDDSGIPSPEDGEGSGEGGTNVPPETGFYRVVRNGIHLLGITNGMTLSGVVTIPVEIANDSGSVVALSVREDGSPVGDSIAIAPFQYPLHVVLDTTTMSNGVHQISGFASWNSDGDEGSGDGVDAESPAITVNVANEITFPNWIDRFGELYDSVLISAQSAHTNADWYIDVYGGDAGYIGTFAGHTYDGNIIASWNLVGPPPNSISYTNERYFDFVITTEFDDGQSGGSQQQSAAVVTSAPKRIYRDTDNWTTKGMWVVANQQAWQNYLSADLLDIASDGFAGMAEGFGLTVRPNRNTGESFRIGYGSGIPESTRNSQWASLRDALYNPESRNFYYLGHGDPTGIGGTTNLSRFIPASEIATQLHTIPTGQTNRHGYRFVFLYGCETASGTLPEAFGIIHRENVSGIDFANAALTPGAFVGWDQKQAAGILGSSLTDNAYFIQHFQLEWTLNGRGVKDALDHAKSDYNDVGFINRNKLKVFGNWDLRPLSFNR